MGGEQPTRALGHGSTFDCTAESELLFPRETPVRQTDVHSAVQLPWKKRHFHLYSRAEGSGGVGLINSLLLKSGGGGSRRLGRLLPKTKLWD